MHLVVKSSTSSKVTRINPARSATFLGGVFELELASLEVIAITTTRDVETLKKSLPTIGKNTYWPRFRLIFSPDNFQITEEAKTRRLIPSQYWNWHQLHTVPLTFSAWDGDKENLEEIEISFEKDPGD